MSILHTVKSSPFQTFALQQCLMLINEQDNLLLIEDAVIAAHAKHSQFEKLKQLSEQGRLRVLSADLEARGISNSIGEQCSYVQFVELVATHQSQMAW